MENSSSLDRSQIRDKVVKLLYLGEFHDKEELSFQYDDFFALFEPVSEEDMKKILERLSQVTEKLGEIDALISRLMTGWKLVRIGKVELSILRLAVFEIVFDESVPNKAAVNEAVELAKVYAGSKAAGFVNGILAKFLKDEDAQ